MQQQYLDRRSPHEHESGPRSLEVGPRGGGALYLHRTMLLVHLALAGLASVAAAEPLLTAKALREGVPSLPLGLHRHLVAQERSAAQPAQGPAWTASSDQLAFSSSDEVQDYPAHTFQQLVSHDPVRPPPPSAPLPSPPGSQS